MVIEAGLVAGYVIAWAVRKARRAAGGLDAEADAVIDAGLDKLHTAVAAKLGAHPALDDLAEEAATDDGQVSELTRQQVELAVTAAARKDDEFGQAVTELVTRLQAAEQAGGISVVAGAGSAVFTGDAHAQASGDGIAFGQVAGDVHLDRGPAGGQRPDPTGPGRSRP
ncbi:chromosome partitioning protein [Actinacidiphila paucisporea]|uniref:Chromosome partitioning protein n=1 Tax=Actinacidiphila paucisporea TaxID=310782 RepID=A0A1M7R0C8_9ACTN|nr:chromosome partitioning protein [Actinacidiphila paucisporea]SHN37965.1 hypothetical protein SAMN05216499_1588 [Actinacidiphila paucisporea]